jgi:ribosomal protein L11 methyltransferase
VETASLALAERAAAEAFAAGAAGCEERGDGPIRLLVYAPAARAAEVREALVQLAGEGLRVESEEPVADVDWAERWRDGLVVVVVSPRLAIRPSFVPHSPPRGQSVLVIDPGQAFGTGSHASTRLALVLLDALPDEERRGARVLDVGTGTGVLALAALRRGAGRAVAVDLDPDATRAARENARRNRLGRRTLVVTGGLGALAPGLFDLVLANLLRTELLPVLPEIAGRLRTGGVAILSGLLDREGAEVERALAAEGLDVEGRLRETDASGDAWLALLTRRAVPRARRRGARRASSPGGGGAPSRSPRAAVPRSRRTTR